MVMSVRHRPGGCHPTCRPSGSHLTCPRLKMIGASFRLRPTADYHEPSAHSAFLPTLAAALLLYGARGPPEPGGRGGPQ